ncbi:hypothetical protein WR25_26369 isoform B [Diploscapter pachys]|uniref:Protein kinase domain-containing protein n=1 Tax=Diploscapter pachys TaxID=2018661 RepID=A0A2A2JIC8_9BILA|nr:hypothetical protein WR25_26369 isoform B [Diploscapter pachys]
MEDNEASGLMVQNSYSFSSISPTPSQKIRSSRDSDLCDTLDIPIVSRKRLEPFNTRIGRGTFGYVTLAQYRESPESEPTKVAIKFANKETTKDSLKREAKVLLQLQENGHCIKIYGMCKYPDKGIGVVMEYMDCKSMAELVNDKKVDYKIGNAISWLYQLSDAIDYFHSRGQVHRDLKCQNLLLSDEYKNLKVCDFGTFKKLDNSMTTNIGTPITMAPEIFEGNKKYDAKCDIYSFGIIMWQIIARRSPYPSRLEAISLLFNVADRKIRPPEIKCSSILSRFYKRCWHPDPNIRPTSSEVKAYFEILRKYYPNTTKPLVHTSTVTSSIVQEPIKIERDNGKIMPKSQNAAMFVENELYARISKLKVKEAKNQGPVKSLNPDVVRPTTSEDMGICLNYENSGSASEATSSPIDSINSPTNSDKNDIPPIEQILEYFRAKELDIQVDFLANKKIIQISAS